MNFKGKIHRYIDGPADGPHIHPPAPFYLSFNAHVGTNCKIGEYYDIDITQTNINTILDQHFIEKGCKYTWPWPVFDCPMQYRIYPNLIVCDAYIYALDTDIITTDSIYCGRAPRDKVSHSFLIKPPYKTPAIINLIYYRGYAT